MPYMTLEEQIASHINFLQNEGLHVETLNTTGEFIRCRSIEDVGRDDRGDHCYKSWINEMDDGRIGIVTWARGPKGKKTKHSTYGNRDGGTSVKIDIGHKAKRVAPTQSDKEGIADEKARLYFEVYSEPAGDSQYLKMKGVNPYGIRFHKSEKYGTSAVVPARDITGRICTCQNLNEDGSKRWLGGRSMEGCFHALTEIEGSPIIGVCEGYATAATCAEALEGLQIAVLCAFDSGNLGKVGLAIQSKYKNARILFLADNDRHLEVCGGLNNGLEAAKNASNRLGATSTWIAPDFANLEPLKELSDWNDLARVHGMDEVRRQIGEGCPKLGVILEKKT